MIVVWRVTQRCNLACPFCGYDRRIERPRRDADVATVTRFGSALADYQRITGDPVLVSWLGGEPLLWPPLRALTQHFTDGLGLRVSTTTNGTPLVSAAVRAHIVEHYAELTVSVDAIGAAHDDLRGWTGGFAHLRRAVRALDAERRDRDRPLLLRANVVLMRETIGTFSALCDELAEWGVDEITFNQLGGEERPEFFAEHCLLPPQVERFAAELPVMRRELESRGVRLGGGDGYMRRLAATTRRLRIPVEDCHPGRSFLFVDETGHAAPCSFTRDVYGVPVAELGSGEAVRELSRVLALRRAASRAPACDDCHSTHVFEKFQVVRLTRAKSAPLVATA